MPVKKKFKHVFYPGFVSCFESQLMSVNLSQSFELSKLGACREGNLEYYCQHGFYSIISRFRRNLNSSYLLQCINFLFCILTYFISDKMRQLKGGKTKGERLNQRLKISYKKIYFFYSSLKLHGGM